MLDAERTKIETRKQCCVNIGSDRVVIQIESGQKVVPSNDM